MDLINSILECLTGKETEPSSLHHPDEKPILPNPNNNTGEDPSTSEIANSILTTLFTASTVDIYTKKHLDETVGAEGWTESIAQAILTGLENAIRAGAAMAPAIKDAFDRATEAAVDFAREHPVYCTIIALGILALLTPWVIEVLGFGELGPIEGSFASWWQARYAGYVPKGSLFSFFQRLGMVWKH